MHVKFLIIYEYGLKYGELHIHYHLFLRPEVWFLFSRFINGDAQTLRSQTTWNYKSTPFTNYPEFFKAMPSIPSQDTYKNPFIKNS